MLELKKRRRVKKATRRPARQVGTLRQVLGWCVHAYTALGLVAAAMIAALIIQGGPNAFRWSFLLMAVATIVDSTDGTLARRVRIKEAVPSFDGRRLDDIIDFLTYTFLPLLLVYRAHILPVGWEAWLIFPALASVYGFCQVEAKTPDGYFLGFPSLWNVVALYLYALPLGPWVSLGVVVLLAVLTFVPTRHLYPSMPGRLNRVSTLLAIPWTVLVFALVWWLPRDSERAIDHGTLRLVYLSLYYPAYYLGVSWAISVAHWYKVARANSSIEQAPREDPEPALGS